MIYRYKNLAFTDYVNFDYSVSDREKVAFSKFSQANPYYRKVNDYGEPEAVLEKYKLMSGDEYVFNPLYDMSLNSSNRTRISASGTILRWIGGLLNSPVESQNQRIEVGV